MPLNEIFRNVGPKCEVREMIGTGGSCLRMSRVQFCFFFFFFLILIYMATLGLATQSSILAWIIPWIEEPGGLQSRGSQRVRHD